MRDLYLELLIPRVLDLPRDGSAFFSQIADSIPEHLPDRMGSLSYGQRIAPGTVSDALVYWHERGQYSVLTGLQKRVILRCVILRVGAD